MSKRRKNDSSMSMLSAKRKPKKTALTPAKLETLPTKYGEAQVLSRPSPSPLAEIYKTEQFQSEWANDIKFHVAQNLLHLRRARGLSQEELALAVGTSQPAIAQIESGEKNVTLDTLERIVVALRGRFFVATPPEECAPLPLHPWWEVHRSASQWNVLGSMIWQSNQTEQALVALKREHRQDLPAQSTLPSPHLLLAASSTGTFYGQETTPTNR